MKVRILQYSAMGLATLGLTLGVAAASSGTISNTGPDSHNDITVEEENTATVHNDNDVTVHNTTNQTANTGEAEVEHNTTGGDATSGSASNTSTATTNATVNNTLSFDGMTMPASTQTASIDTTGPDSHNKVKMEIENKLNIHNDNDVYVSNTTNQTASSGEASVEDNTTGGSATSGDATNSSTTSTTVSVSN